MGKSKKRLPRERGKRSEKETGVALSSLHTFRFTNMGGTTTQEEDSIPEHKELTRLEGIPPASRRLPPELISLILTSTEDWELATTLGVRTNLPKPGPWEEFATPLDRAILRSSTSTIPVLYAALKDNHTNFTQWGARVMLRFGYVHVLDWFSKTDLKQLKRECKSLLPIVASAWGRTKVLEWAQSSLLGLKPDPKTTAEAIDEASRHGQVEGKPITFILFSPPSELRTNARFVSC